MNLLLLGLGGVALYFLFRPHPRFLGDKAQKGDLVFVPVAPGGAGFPGLPAGAGQVVVQVTDTSGPDILLGPIVGYALAGASSVGYAQVGPLPNPGGVNRANVTAIRRGDLSIT